jgi:hypothetical protein
MRLGGLDDGLHHASRDHWLCPFPEFAGSARSHRAMPDLYFFNVWNACGAMLMERGAA